MTLTEAEARAKECQLRVNGALILASLEAMMLAHDGTVFGMAAAQRCSELIAKFGMCVASDCCHWEWAKYSDEPSHVRRPCQEYGGYCGLIRRAGRAAK